MAMVNKKAYIVSGTVAKSFPVNPLKRDFNGADAEILQLKLKLDSAGKSENRFKIGFFILLSFVCLLASGILAVFYIATTTIDRVEARAISTIESNRVTLIAGLYTVNKLITENIPVRAQRFEMYAKKAKAKILSKNPKTDLTDNDINRLLKVNFDLAEQYNYSPWLFHAFAQIESNHYKGVKSAISGASGIVQFMPNTMKMVLGSDYVPGMEFDPVWSCKAWYKYILYLSEATGGDLKWTAAAYLSPEALRYMRTGKNVDSFMEWIAGNTIQNHKKYPYIIEKLYEEFLSL